MKPISLRTIALAAPLVGALAVAYGCAPEDTTGDVNATGGGAGSPTTSGGMVTTAGNSSVGGGSTTAGNATGGVSTGGTPAGGMGPAAGNSTGGVTAGGTPGGGADAGGTGGASGGSSGCGDTKACIDVVANAMSSFGNPGWKDSWWVTGCDQKNSNDCITNGTSCNAKDNNAPGASPEEKGARTTESWTLGGTPGQHYKVTFTFNAVTELKRYKGGHRDKAVIENDPHNTPLDTFYRDGSLDLTNYNVVKLKIFDEAGVEKRHFYMNAAPDTGALTDYESHFTWLVSYTKSIVVIGGGKIEHFVEDSNCHAIDNCGGAYVEGAACPSPRKLPGGDDTLTLPLKYQDPKDGTIKNTTQLTAGYPNPGLTQPWHAQAGHFKITAIEPTADDIAKDYF